MLVGQMSECRNIATFFDICRKTPSFCVVYLALSWIGVHTVFVRHDEYQGGAEPRDHKVPVGSVALDSNQSLQVLILLPNSQ